MNKRLAGSGHKRHRVELKFLESVRHRLPHHARVLEALGNLYTRVGRYEEGLQVDLDLTRMRPEDPENWYNLACSCALTARPEEAFRALEQAFGLGYRDGDWLMEDPDLKSLRSDPRFLALIARMRKIKQS
jgi:Flp pilus assembly protein TadD